MTGSVDRRLAYEQGELSANETLDLFADLVSTGLAYKLQRSYGRTAEALIRAGQLNAEGKVLRYAEEDEDQ